MRNNTDPDNSQAARYLRLISNVNDLRELRVLAKEKGTLGRGWYDDCDRLAAEACKQSGKGRGCYVTLNPINRQKRRPHGFARGCDATKGTEISKRSLLLIDVDPVRTTGNSDEPTTDSEHQAAIDCVHRIANDLKAAGIAADILLDTGNGAAVLLGIDLPADDGGLVKRFLEHMDRRYSDGSVKIDTTVHDAGRISRIPGTLNAKGTPTADRPHRYARIIQAPDELVVVSRDFLESYAGVTATPANDPYDSDSWDQQAEGPEYGPFDVGAFLAEKNIKFTQRNGTLGKKKGRWFDLALCPFKPEPNATGHTGIFQGDDGEIRFHCFHDKCSTKDWEDFLNHVYPGYIKRVTQEVNGHERAIIDPIRLAEIFSRRFDHPDHPRIMLWDESILTWDQVWAEKTDKCIKRLLNACCGKVFLDYAARLRAKGVFIYPPMTSTRLIGDVYLALTSMIPNYKGLRTGQWLIGTGPDASGLIIAKNGIVDLHRYVDGQDNYLMPHTPRLLAMNKLGYDFDPKASQPSRLHQFLEELFEDTECRALAQEVFALALTADSRHQVFVVFQGQTAGGKGTLARHLVAMLGDHNTCSIDFDKLSQRFALEEAVDKQLIVMPEVKLPDKEDGSTDMIKKMTGQDPVRVDRKHIPARTVSKWGLILMVSNHDISPADASGAFYRRMIPLKFTQSFEATKDVELNDKLASELPGTLLWAIEGWRRLRDTKRFTMPQSSQALKEQLRDAGSPILAFGKQHCVFGDHEKIEKNELLRAFNSFLEQRDERSVTKARLTALLSSAFPRVTSYRPEVEGARLNCYKGISLKPAYLSKPAIASYGNESPSNNWLCELARFPGSFSGSVQRRPFCRTEKTASSVQRMQNLWRLITVGGTLFFHSGLPPQHRQSYGDGGSNPISSSFAKQL